jgi:choline kinase
VGCREIVLVTGYKAEAIPAGDVIRVRNADYRNNNILHSLMHARRYFDGPLVVSYSDIWVEPRIHEKLMSTAGDIVLAVDRDWQVYYEGRTDHPVSEAEKVHFSADGRVAAFGKYLPVEAPAGLACGEFPGLWRMSAAGSALFRSEFQALERKLDRDAPFQHAQRWRNAYISDFVEHLAMAGTRIDYALVERGWAELDTEQDYRRLPAVAKRQGLDTITRWMTPRKDS